MKPNLNQLRNLEELYCCLPRTITGRYEGEGCFAAFCQSKPDVTELLNMEQLKRKFPANENCQGASFSANISPNTQRQIQRRR